MLTVDRAAPADGSVPQAYHWCLCLPDAPTAILGADGHLHVRAAGQVQDAVIGIAEQRLQRRRTVGQRKAHGRRRSETCIDQLGQRGTDLRLEEAGGRRTSAQRREEFHARKDAQTAAREGLWTERQAGHWTEDD